MNICTVILAAGKGTRMKSKKSKVMHEILGLPLVWYPTNLAQQAHSEVIAVTGHQHEKVDAYLETLGVACVLQDPPLGTGHAVMQARTRLENSDAGHVIIIPGDMPLITKDSISRMISTYEDSDAPMCVLTAELDDPTGYGRIVRNDDNTLEAIVEEREATQKQRLIREVNTGVYITRKDFLLEAIDKLNPENKKGEFYLTDIVALAGNAVSSGVTDPNEANGINSQKQLAFASSVMQQRINCSHMEEGVTIMDPRTCWIGPLTKLQNDITIWPNVHILGESSIAGDVEIMPNTWINDSNIAEGCTVSPGCSIQGTDIPADSFVAPCSDIVE